MIHFSLECDPQSGCRGGLRNMAQCPAGEFGFFRGLWGYRKRRALRSLGIPATVQEDEAELLHPFPH